MVHKLQFIFWQGFPETQVCEETPNQISCLGYKEIVCEGKSFLEATLVNCLPLVATLQWASYKPEQLQVFTEVVKPVFLALMDWDSIPWWPPPSASYLFYNSYQLTLPR